MTLSLKGNVAVLYGGSSPERAVSLESGKAVFDALLRNNINPLLIDPKQVDLLSALKDGQVKHVVNMLHGGFGENGQLQALLNFLQITYTGSPVLASALAMDKLRCKQLWMGIGLPTPAYQLLTEQSHWQEVLGDLNGEVIVKPSNEGSSIGMHRAASAEQLKAAWDDASQYDKSILAEQWIDGKEYTVSILAGKTLPTIELQTDNDFYDYQAKYVSNDTRYLCPCDLTDKEQLEIKQLSEQAFKSLGCSGWGRVDFMRDKAGKFWLLEVNTVPGMTSHSLVPMAAKAAGLSFDELVMQIFTASLAVEVNCD